MTLTRSSVESPTFGGATSPEGSHTSSADRTVTAGRLQLLVTHSHGDAGFPDEHVVTDTFNSFAWTEIPEGQITLETFLAVQGFTRYVRVQLWYGYATATEAKRTTVDFGTIGGDLSATHAGSGWNHRQIAGFTTPPWDDGRSLIRNLFTSGDDAPSTVFGGEDALRMDLPALLNAESLSVLFPLVEHSSSAQSVMYSTDGTKDVLVAGSAFPYPQEVMLRNSADIYGADGDDGGDPGSWAAVAFEVGEEPVAQPVQLGVTGAIDMQGFVLPVRMNFPRRSPWMSGRRR